VTLLQSRLGILLMGLAVTVPACGSTPQIQPAPEAPSVVWPAPTNPLELTVSAGLKPEPKETLHFHVHAHLDVFINGSGVQVPAGIGININDPGVKHGQWNGDPAYGGIAGCAQPCISPLHTHDDSGVIHTESSNSTPNRLGEFFIEWNVPLTSTCVGEYCSPATPIVVYVDGKRYAGNPADISLTDRKEIAVVVGSAPKQIPNSFPSWAPG
jgi:hypothetical protein